jgi:hypothetical protein
MKPTEPLDSGQQCPSPSLVNAADLLRDLFPSIDSRPSLRWLRRMQARGLVPFKKIGRLVFFDPEEVRRALDRQFSIHAKNL